MFLKEHDWDEQKYVAAYRNQLAHVNTRLLRVVDRIRAKQRPAVIILQGDHGPRSRFYLSLDSELREGFGILNAVLLPEGDSAGFYDHVTPVNTFRLVFNRYFGTELKLLEDECYFEKPTYEFVHVTRDATRVSVAVNP
jgi:hypothetical protein